MYFFVEQTAGFWNGNDVEVNKKFAISGTTFFETLPKFYKEKPKEIINLFTLNIRRW